MPHYTYLIIGGGMTADAAVQGIRQLDGESSIGLISAEANPPYDRPPLTKSLWIGDKEMEEIWRGTADRRADLHLGRRAQTLDLEQNLVTDDLGGSYTFNKLLLATGGITKKLPFGRESILYYRSVEHYQHLRDLTRNKSKFAVIGGGFIGAEISAALAMNDQEVSIIFPDPGISGHLFPRDLATFLNNYYQDKGVEVISGDSVIDVEKGEQTTILKTKSGRELQVDAIVAGIGIRPNTDLAERAELEVDDGIVVDEYLRTSHPDVYAAGDVANFFNPTLNKRMRVEHEDNANTMGEAAGRNMASHQTGGEGAPYNHLPYFYSDLFDLGYEAVGEINAKLETYADWEEEFKKGVVYYLKDERVRGVLLWNVWGQVDAARSLLAEPGPIKSAALKGRLPE